MIGRKILGGLFAGLLASSCGGESRTSEEVSESAFRDGQTIYREYCQTCHGADGQGIEGVFPPLKNSRFLDDRNKTISSVVNGLSEPIVVDGVDYHGVMPPLPPTYSDEEAAAVINWVIATYGTEQWTTDAEEVASLRE